METAQVCESVQSQISPLWYRSLLASNNKKSEDDFNIKQGDNSSSM